MPAISSVSAASPVQKGSAQPSLPRESEAAGPSSGQPAATPPAADVAPVVNPSLRFDLKLGLVVVEFFDETGQVANSVPSPQKLKAYEAGLSSGPGFAPAGAGPAPEKDPSAGSGEARPAGGRLGRDGIAVLA